MSNQYVISQLERNIQVFHKMLIEIPEEIITWRSQPEKWNLLEIVCHLYDEEREDFRFRLNHVLEHAEQPMPPIDPVKWVTERNYGSKNFFETLNDFIYERKKSIEWLRGLNNPDWEKFYQHPKVGPLTAKLFLCNWLAHDYLHVRQITKLKYDYLKFISGVSLDYAGKW